MMRFFLFVLIFIGTFSQRSHALEANVLFDSLRSKVLSVRDYTAKVRMKIDVNYMRIPPLNGTLYYKAPDKMKLKRKGGLSILPKKNINLTLRNLIPSGGVMVFDAGQDTINGKQVRIIKVIPNDDKSEIVLTKMWVDEKRLLALRTETTTRNEGTVIMDLVYKTYLSYALPDQVTIRMDIKEYSLPKGVTMDYNDLPEPKNVKKVKNKKGSIQITYLSYLINKGISDEIFAGEDD